LLRRNNRFQRFHTATITEVELEARTLIKSLHTATDGRPLLWRTIIGLSAKRVAVDYAVERGWIIIESDRSICLTVKGARLVRDAKAWAAGGDVERLHRDLGGVVGAAE